MKSEKGQALVEMAFMLPILLMLLFGITDFGRLFHVYLTLDHAGREAARTAAVGTEDTIIIGKINDATISLNKDGGKFNYTISQAGKSNRKSGDDVTITLTYKFDFLTPFVDLGDKFEVKNKTVMRVE